MEEVLKILEKYYDDVSESEYNIRHECGVDDAQFMTGVKFGVNECIKVIKSRL